MRAKRADTHPKTVEKRRRPEPTPACIQAIAARPLGEQAKRFYGQIIFQRPRRPCFQKQLGLVGGPQARA